MAWQTDSVQIIRTLIHDVDPSAYVYTDERLEEVFVISAYNIITDIVFDTTYTITISTNTISPTPVSDKYVMNLVSLKAASIILFSEYKTASNSAVKVVDGPSTIDYTAVSKNLKELYNNAVEQYEQMKYRYYTGEGAGGIVVLTPYSPGSDFYSYRSHGCR
jgi:hypothetical protein